MSTANDMRSTRAILKYPMVTSTRVQSVVPPFPGGQSTYTPANAICGRMKLKRAAKDKVNFLFMG